jgi:haloalkane dehalogenase
MSGLVKTFRTPDERFENLPGYTFEPRYLEQDGLRMHYVEEGVGDPVLLLHGEPSWAFLYRKLIPPLAQVARVVAPDYFGFGRSDKPTRIEDYSYDFHYGSIERLADELDLRESTVVVQDWGGPVGLRLAVERPERVARLVILNTGIGAGRAPSEEWLRFREFMRRVGTDLVPGQLVRISCVNELPDDVVEAYNAPFPTPESKAGVLAFPELVPTELGHPSAPKMLRCGPASNAGRSPRSSSSPTRTRSSRRLRPSAWRRGSRAPARPRSSRAQATSSKRRKARRSRSGSSASSGRARARSR